MRVMEEPVEQRGDGGGVAEELAPVFHGAVGRDYVESRVKLLVIDEVG
jgi:hypothetical protein